MLKKLLLPALAVLLPSLVSAGPLTTIVVVGDSLSDQGNGFLLTGGTFPPPPYAGRASNGPVAVEWMAAALGVPLQPAAAGGTNYAVLGATTGPVAVAGTNPPVITDNITTVLYGQSALANTGLLNQAASFAASGTPFDPASTLFVVWGGANDFFVNPSVGTAAGALGNLANTIGLLYGAGGRQFLVPNMPDLSLTPSGREQDPFIQAALRALSLGFNAELETTLLTLDVLPGIDITRFDTFGLLTMVAANPAAFGLSNVSDPCLTGDLSGGAGVVCADPASYLFWDSVHPTTRAHQFLGRQFARAVPEPAVLALFGLGLVAAVRYSARKRSIRH